MRAGSFLLSGFAALAMLASAPAFAQTDQDPAAQVELRSFEDILNQAKGNMMRDPQAALDFVAEAEAVLNAGRGPADTDMAAAEIGWLRSEAMTRVGRPEDASPVAQAALDRFGVDDERGKLYADILVSLARTNRLTGEYGLALENFQAAYVIFQEIGHTRSESIVLQSMGSMFRDAHQDARAVQYFIDATERHQGDPALELSARNNLGNAYRELGQYDDAMDSLRRALAIAVEMDSGLLQARILNNIAHLNVQFGDFDAADRSLDQAFALVEGEESEWTRFFWGIRAMTAAGRGDYHAAERSIRHTFDGVSVRESTQGFTEYHEAAAEIFRAVGEFNLAVQHLEAFKRLDDEARDLAASANTALLSARFDFAEQELQIEQLRTEGLQQDLALADARSRQRLLAAGGIAAILLLVLIGGLMLYRAQRQKQKALERSLYEDVETGLPSRQAAVRCFDQAGRQCPDNEIIVAAALSIERFKHLEAALGFEKIAEVKQAMADRLAAGLNAEMIASADSGVVLLVLRVPSIAAALVDLESAQAGFAAPVELDDLEIDIALTAGIATGGSGEAALKNATVAVEQARVDFRPRAVFDETRHASQRPNLSLMSCMLKAMHTGEMELHYQPKLHLPSGEYRAAEALVRWNDTVRGYVSPDLFIGLAEETGHIRDFTVWSIERVVADQKVLREAGHDLLLAVNVSAALISDDTFAQQALEIADRAEGQICFEITETAAMRNPDAAMANLQNWRDAGIKLAIDDYGSGLSSLAYLRSLPSHELKLDRAFVQNVAKSQRDRMLVKSTADLAHALALEMTAEGVECEAGLAVLKMFGCDWAQGFILSKARSLGSLIGFLDENRTADVERPSGRASGNPSI